MGTASMSADLYLRICEDPALLSAGIRVPLGRKALALLSYIAVEPGPHCRAQLSALLWPEADESHASMSLRQALARLREVLGDRLHCDRSEVALHASSDGPLPSDYAHFRATIASDPLNGARFAVHRFLAALPVDDAPELLHWADRTRAQLTRVAAAALERFAAEAAARRDWPTVTRAAERWIELSPLSDDAVCRAVEAACMRRDLSHALELREAFVARRRDDGSLPGQGSGRVDDVLRKLGSLATPTPVRGVPAAGTSANTDHDISVVRGSVVVPFVPPLKDRDALWQRITHTFDHVAERGTSARLLLSGALGSGRSRLLQDATAWMASCGATVLTAGTTPTSTALPYYIVASLIRSALDSPALAGIDGQHLRTMMALVPELGDRFPAVRRTGDADVATEGAFPWRLQEALWQALLAMAEDAPVVIALDDIIWGDQESAVVLQMLLRRNDSAPVLWLFSGADERASERSQHAWIEVMQDAIVLELPPLSEASIVEMLGDCFGATNASLADREDWAPLASRLHAASHGVAGLVTSAVEQLRARVGDDAVALQQQPVPVPMPSLAQQRRISELDDMSEAALLSLALVMEIGHPVEAYAWHSRPALTLGQLSHLHGISRLRAAMIGQRLVAARLAVEDHSGYRCASPAIVGFMIERSSGLLREEMRRVMQVEPTSRQA
ncbi:AAA family ATPase [Gemmatimonas sp.]|uniref:AAA family ATPase n=1 Tax=Gemmatimonas sp. TaxID=1962908 RepID=UPI0039830703